MAKCESSLLGLFLEKVYIYVHIKLYLFILAVLTLVAAWAVSVAVSAAGLQSARGLPVAVASSVAEHRLWGVGFSRPGLAGSLVAAPKL